MMNKLFAVCWLALTPALVLGATGTQLMQAEIDLHDKASLQRGARLFLNYCASCHSASFMRYNRLAEDLGLTDEQVEQNMMFAADKVVEPITVAMHSKDAASWFGAAPPDLSVVSRSRGSDWLYTYLLTFYKDDDSTRPFGVNNLAFAGTSMPHVLWELQGIQVPVYEEHEGADGHKTKEIVGFELEQAGLMNPAQYKKAVGDLVNFLTYLGEPAKLDRYRIGTWVLIFLVILFFLSRALYKEYWKDVH